MVDKVSESNSIFFLPSSVKFDFDESNFNSVRLLKAVTNTPKFLESLKLLGLVDPGKETVAKKGGRPRYLDNLLKACLHMVPQMFAAKGLSALAGKVLTCHYGLPVTAGVLLIINGYKIYDSIQSGKATPVSVAAATMQQVIHAAVTASGISARGLSDPMAGSEQISLFIYAFVRDSANYFFSLQNASPSPASVASTISSGLSYVSIMEFLSFLSAKPGELASSPDLKASIDFLSGVVASALTESFDNVNYASIAAWFNNATPELDYKLRKKEDISAKGFAEHMGKGVFPGRGALLSSYGEIMNILKLLLPEEILKPAGATCIFILYLVFAGTFLTRPEAKNDAENPEETSDGRSTDYETTCIVINEKKPQ